MMKKLFYVLILSLIFTGCHESTMTTEPDNTTKFSSQSIIGTWVCVDDSNNVEWYYDIKNDTHLLWMEKVSGVAVYDPSDGYLHIKSGSEWKESGDFIYVFKESKQIIKITGGSVYGFPVVKEIVKELGTNDAFCVERIGLDEAYLWSKIKDVALFDGWVTFTIYDSHAFRIKGIKEDL